MCSLTFLPHNTGFLLAMNRDERWTRGALSHAPERIEVQGVSAVCPKDAQGGTWIGLNEYGLAFAILNRNFSAQGYARTRSRGSVISTLLSTGDMAVVLQRLSVDIADGTLPFTLVVISSPDQGICEVAYDGAQLSTRTHPWQRHHWFSSGLSDQDAYLHRSEAVAAFLSDPDAESKHWVRRLHRSHLAGEAFSVCVHRDLVGSVSYTEIEVTETQGCMAYSAGSPCTDADPVTICLPMRISQKTVMS